MPPEKITLDHLSENEKWWLCAVWPITESRVVAVLAEEQLSRNPDPLIISFLCAKKLIEERRDWVKNEPIFYLTTNGERLRKELNNG